MSVLVDSSFSKEEIFKVVEDYLQKLGINIVSCDKNRPWGGFYVIDETQIGVFREKFFPEVELSKEQLSLKLSPKILIVGPGKRLSWQYHHRRAEIWKLIFGESSIARSPNDVETPKQAMEIGEVIRLAQGERHRLIGDNNWGIVAEIWMHIDPENPSNEEDIVRVQDDFARK